MPSDPDNTRMDEALKAFAKRRRDEAGAPFELHPATRQLLQGEVARTFPKSAPESKSWIQSVLMFWPRLAFAAALFAVLGVVCWVSFLGPHMRQQSTSLAKNKEIAPVELFDQPLGEIDKPAPAYKSAPANAEKKFDTDFVRLDDESKLTEPKALKKLAADSREETKLPESQVRLSGQTQPGEKGVAMEAGTRSPNKLDGVELSRARRDAESAQRFTLSYQENSLAKAPPPPGFAPAPTRGLRAPAPVADAPARALPSLAQSTPASPAPRPNAALSFDAAPVPQTPRSVALNQLATGPGAQQAGYEFSLKPAAPAVAAQSGSATFQREWSDSGDAKAAAGNVQRFFRESVTTQAAAPQTVFASFDFDQDGDRIQIREPDGSVYEGRALTAVESERFAASLDGGVTPERRARLQSAPEPQKLEAVKRQTADPASGRAVNFRVSGTNRTLRQLVVLHGTVTSDERASVLARSDKDAASFAGVAPAPASPGAGTAPAASGRGGFGANPGAGTTATKQAGASTQTTPAARFRAKARIGPATNEIEINAIRVTR